jgi:hypothetical protein
MTFCGNSRSIFFAVKKFFLKNSKFMFKTRKSGYIYYMGLIRRCFSVDVLAGNPVPGYRERSESFLLNLQYFLVELRHKVWQKENEYVS